MIKKTIFTNCLLVFTSIIITIILLEVLLRLFGFTPWQFYQSDLNEPTINKYDSKVGWKPKKGIYIFPPKSDNANNTTFTILKDGSRFSGESIDISKGDVVFVGGSITQGVAVDDKETFSFYLQNKLTDYKVKNYGVGGYGTYQSYLLLKDLLKNENNIKHIIYFFIEPHEIRNVGDASWLNILTRFSKRKHVHLPYAQLDKHDNLVEYLPVKYIELPFRKYSALITRVEKKIMRIKLYSKYKDETKIAQKIILKMKEISKKNGSKFLFINLYSDKNKLKSYFEFSKKNKVTFVDCEHPLIEGFRVQNDGHPNAKSHKLYSDCIYSKVFN